MEFATLIGIVILVWYYGHSLNIAHDADEVARKADDLFKFQLLSELDKIKKSIDQVAENVGHLEKSVLEIDKTAHREPYDSAPKHYTKKNLP